MFDVFVCPSIERKLGIQGADTFPKINPNTCLNIITIANSVVDVDNIYSIST